MSRLRSIRLTWPQIALVAAASALSTGVIVDAGTRGQAAPDSTLAALRRTVAVHRVPSSAPASPPVTAATGPASAPAPALPPARLAPAAPVSAPSTAGTAAPASTTAEAGSGAGTTPAAATQPASAGHPGRHVFVIALTTTSYRAAFGPGSVAHYLNRTLRRRGVLLSRYHTLGGSELPDYLAMVSGQAPNADTRRDCPTYAEFSASAKSLASGQVSGAGCVYPNTVLTIADQVTAAGKQWKAYLADMGTSPCMHPDSGAADGGQLPGAGPQYVPWHNPFVYFHSLLDLGGCSSDDVGLQRLPRDLHSAGRTPNYAFIAPGGCDEPASAPCPAGQPGGLRAEDAFLKRWVPAITGSAAYKQDGLLMIVFAKAPAAAGSGPLRTGALILSPTAKPGTTVSTSYTPYSVLRSAEDLFGYAPLVHAKAAPSFAGLAAP
jgi:phosphatidylinositol-3-phosphatase